MIQTASTATDIHVFSIVSLSDPKRMILATPIATAAGFSVF